MEIPVHEVHLRNRLFAQLSLPMQIWVGQQAQRIVRSGRFGGGEAQLNEAIRLKLSQGSSVAGATPAVVTSILRYLTLTDSVMSMEESLDAAGDEAQLANVDLQNILQKQQQTLQVLSNISKELYDTAMAVIRHIGS